MPAILHILTQAEDALARELIEKQKEKSENQIEIVDLSDPNPDYKKLLEKIFTADSVQVW